MYWMELEVQIPMRRGNFDGVSCAETAEPIEMPFGVWTRMRPRKHVLNGVERWRHLTNTIQPSMCGGDAAFCQITLSTCETC